MQAVNTDQAPTAATRISWPARLRSLLSPQDVTRPGFGRGLGACLLLSSIVAVAGGGLSLASHPAHAAVAPATPTAVPTSIPPLRPVAIPTATATAVPTSFPPLRPAVIPTTTPTAIPAG